MELLRGVKPVALETEMCPREQPSVENCSFVCDRRDDTALSVLMGRLIDALTLKV